jgi:hypothetical protein
MRCRPDVFIRERPVRRDQCLPIKPRAEIEISLARKRMASGVHPRTMRAKIYSQIPRNDDICVTLGTSQPTKKIGRKKMATNPRQTERDSSDEVRKVGHQAAQTTRATTEATQRTVRAGADALQEYASSASETWRTGSETASRIAQRSMDELSRIYGLSGDATRHAMEQSSNGAQVFLESTSLMAHTCQDLSGEWMRFVQATSERNLQCLDQLMACRSIPDCLALQAQAVRDNFEAFLHSARRTSERSTHAIDQAARRMGGALAPQ